MVTEKTRSLRKCLPIADLLTFAPGTAARPTVSFQCKLYHPRQGYVDDGGLLRTTATLRRSPHRFSRPDHRRAIRIPHLDPVPARARAVRRGEPLRDNASKPIWQVQRDEDGHTVWGLRTMTVGRGCEPRSSDSGRSILEPAGTYRERPPIVTDPRARPFGSRFSLLQRLPG